GLLSGARLARWMIMLATLLALIAGCGDGRHSHDDHAHDSRGHGHHDEHNEPTGPNGGRLLEDGEIQVELRIFEAGVPPEWRGWVYRAGELLPESGALTVTTTRLGGESARDRLRPAGSFRRGQRVVGEPHSFVVDVELELDGRAYQWRFNSFEGRTRIAPAMAEQSGIVTRPAGPGTIREQHDAFGLLTLVEGRHARVGARFDGLVLEVGAGVGETVRQGQRLARIESNRGLSEYPLVAPLDGVVLRRRIEPGEAIVAGAEAFEVADLSTLWVDLHMFGVDADRLEPGLRLRVRDIGRTRQRDSRIERILPMTASASQSTIARGVLDNADGQWRPGSAIVAEVTLNEIPVELAVPVSALQTWRERDVVFQRIGDVYEVRPVELGRRDGLIAEVRSGLRPGAEIVVRHSFLIKADIEKSGVTHAH
ncbi:MAG: efflux RND transporter periplasmic adaptor subunit, partial [Wenzhouxiangellaceae bacterium]